MRPWGEKKQKKQKGKKRKKIKTNSISLRDKFWLELIQLVY